MIKQSISWPRRIQLGTELLTCDKNLQEYWNLFLLLTKRCIGFRLKEYFINVNSKSNMEKNVFKNETKWRVLIFFSSKAHQI